MLISMANKLMNTQIDPMHYSRMRWHMLVHSLSLFTHRMCMHSFDPKVFVNCLQAVEKDPRVKTVHALSMCEEWQWMNQHVPPHPTLMLFVFGIAHLHSCTSHVFTCCSFLFIVWTQCPAPSCSGWPCQHHPLPGHQDGVAAPQLWQWWKGHDPLGSLVRPCWCRPAGHWPV